MIISGVIILNQQTYQEFIDQMRKAVNDYKKDVINQKYSNDLDELQFLKEDLNRQTQEFFRSNQSQMNPEIMARIDSEMQESMDYVNLIFSETERFIKMDSNLSKVDADVLLAQNTFIRNLSLRDEISVRMKYYEKVSLKEQTRVNKNQPLSVADRQRFVPLSNAEGRTKDILVDYATEYQKLVDMKKNLNQLLQKDRNKMQSLYMKQVKEGLAISLGEIKVADIRPEIRFTSSEEIKKQARYLLLEIQKLDRHPGMKEKFEFIFEGKTYTVLVPLGKKPFFEKALLDLAAYRDVLKEREFMENKLQSMKSELQVKEEKYIDIKIDEHLLESQTVQQKLSYLQTIMLRIEGITSGNQIEIKDLKGNYKTIPAYYYSVYQDCKERIWEISLTIDEKYVASLTIEQKIDFYERLMERMEFIPWVPKIAIDGKEIPAKYSDKYIKARNTVNRLKMELHLKQNTPIMIGEDSNLQEYLINEAYAETLSVDDKIVYYSNLIGKAITCPVEPKVSYEALGVKITIPVSLVNTVKECERNVKMYLEQKKLMINEVEVSSRSPEMQFTYYGRLIEKMRRSEKGPKIQVEAFSESFEIPFECKDTFYECMKRMEELKQKFAIQNKKKHKVRKVRKPRFNKVKEYLKKLSNRLKVGFAIGVSVATLAVTSIAAGIAVGRLLVGEKAMSEQQQETIATLPLTSDKTINIKEIEGELVDPVVSIHKESALEARANQMDNVSGQILDIDRVQQMEGTTKQSTNDEKINQWINASKQSISSRFGATFKSNNGIVYNSAIDKEPKTIRASFANEIFTVTKIVLNVPGEGIKEVNYRMPNAQQIVDDYIQRGAVVIRNSAVAQHSEDNYKQNGIETAYFDLNGIDMISYPEQSNTLLSKEILEYINQSKGMSR